MWFFSIGIFLLVVGAFASLVLGKNPKLASISGAAAAVAGGSFALINAVEVLFSGQSVEILIPWQMPLGKITLGLDPLSATFVLPIVVVMALAAVYAVQYLEGSHIQMTVGGIWFFFNILAASMLLVVTARNGWLFLMCWEMMSLASFFLVISQYDSESVRRAGWIYLVAMHLGTACLLVLFLLLGRQSGSLDFSRFSAEPGMAGIMFLLAVVGFGTKAGFIPVHVWLPEAHPAAPSHVSAVMSGVMIKTGIYGLVRTITFLGEVPSWWGWTLIGIGVASGILGVLFALAQHDLKRLLAYHSVENIGIIAMGLGVGMLGISYQIPAMAVLGFLGALLHVINHALFKSLLFLGAGAIQHSTGTRDMDRLGGLLKRMPVTGGTFLVGSTAILGLPPLNGFVSELLIYLGVLAGVTEANKSSGMAWVLICVLVIGGLALIGGLAAACFAKAFGCIFLGEPRGEEAKHGHEVGLAMRIPMLMLAAACILVAMTAPLWPIVLRSSVASINPAFFGKLSELIYSRAVLPLVILCGTSWVLLAMVGIIFYVRKKLLSGRHSRKPLRGIAVMPLQRRDAIHGVVVCQPVGDPFPHVIKTENAAYRTARPFSPAGELPFGDYGRFSRLFVSSHISWSGLGGFQVAVASAWPIQLYVLYIALTILVLLIWKLGK